MSKLDEVKEILNTLRVALSVGIGLLALVVSGLVGRLDDGRVDAVFWLGVMAAFLLVGGVFWIVRKLSDKTKEIKDL
jgi:hypothetical protein